MARFVSVLFALIFSMVAVYANAETPLVAGDKNKEDKTKESSSLSGGVPQFSHKDVMRIHYLLRIFHY